MLLLLTSLIVFLTLSLAFDFDPGPAPGLKIKNAFLYVIVLGIMLRAAITQRFRLQLPAMLVLFGTLVGYALLTYAAIVLVLDYPRYPALGNGFLLKNQLIDPMFFFLVFFYGLSTDQDATTMLKRLLACFALSHLVAVLHALGWVQLGDIETRDNGRVEGTIGESNQYGAFAAYCAPALAALFFATRGLQRLWWLIAAVIALIALLMTVSRGAYVAMTLAVAAGFLLFRRYASPGKLAMYAFVLSAGAVVLIAVVFAAGYGGLVIERVIQGVSLADLETTSSGRTEIWGTAIETMFERPLSLLTGYGWNAYASMPMRHAPHNHFLAYWFNLGLVGLACTALLLYVPANTARTAIDNASPDVRPVLMGFVVATIALATAVFFVDLYKPWLFYWSYAGIVMRLAVNARERSAPAMAPVPAVEQSRIAPRDPFGWSGRPATLMDRRR